MAGFRMFRARGLAYSLRKMAVPSPAGAATRSAQNVTRNVAWSRGRTPKEPGSNSGAQAVPVKNSQRLISVKNSIAEKFYCCRSC